MPPTQAAKKAAAKKTASSSTTSTKTESKPDVNDNPSPNPASDGTDHPELTPSPTETKTVQVQAEVPVEDNEPEIKTKTEDREFVVAQTLDERRSIPGTSQYLDEVERRNAEIIRAKAEDRKPDLDNPPAFQGTPLYTKAQAKQQGLDPEVESAQAVTLPVTVDETDPANEAFVNYDANNGYGASKLVNSGTPRG